MPAYHAKRDFQDYVEQHGLPVPLPRTLRDEMLANKLVPPVIRQNIGLVLPPHVGDGDPDLVDPATGQILEEGGPRCGHCGRRVGADEGLMLHAVAGLEHASHVSLGEPLRLLLRHCGDCLGSAHCDPERTSPGVVTAEGLPSGFCEPYTGTPAAGPGVGGGA